jgi:hypothetical protein
MFEGHVGRHILYEQPHPQEILGLRDLPRKQFDGFTGVRQRQQIVEMFAAGMPPAASPAPMVTPQDRAAVAMSESTETVKSEVTLKLPPGVTAEKTGGPKYTPGLNLQPTGAL